MTPSDEVRIALLALAAMIVLQGCGAEQSTQAANRAGLALEVPAAPGSTSPKLAAGAGGRLILSWLEPDDSGYRLRYSILDEAAWGAAQTVARGDNWFINWADFPSVVQISESLLAAHWLVRQPAGGYAYDVNLSISTDGGRNWSAPVMPHDDGTPTEHGFVTLFPRPAGVGAVWLDGRDTEPEPASGHAHGGMTLRSATFTDDLEVTDKARIDDLVCDCCQTDVATTSSGPVVVYRDRSVDETRDISIARYVDDSWQPGDSVADDGWTIGGCPVNGPAIDADDDQVAVAWFTAADDNPRIRVARSADGGRTMSAPLDISEGETPGRAGIALLDHGDLAVSWICRRDGAFRVCLRRVAADDRLGPVQLLSQSDNIPALSVPQLARMGEFLVAAWTVDEDGRKSIRSSRMPFSALP